MSNTLILLANLKGRDFVVGDIHGAFELLDLALQQAGFDPAKDRLISVGDLINRGPSSPRALEFLKQSWFFAVRGNHEDMYLDMVSNGRLDILKAADQVRNGMRWIFDQSAGTLLALEEEFKKLPVAIEITTAHGPVGIAHAEVPAGMTWQDFMAALDKNDPDAIGCALSGRDRIKSGNTSGVPGAYRLFHGHTPQRGGTVALGNCFYIDTAAAFGLKKQDENGFLTLADIMAEAASLSAPPAPQANGIKVITAVPQPEGPDVPLCENTSLPLPGCR